MSSKLSDSVVEGPRGGLTLWKVLGMLALVAPLTLVGCRAGQVGGGDGEGTPDNDCVDNDGDGRGTGCNLGPDCNDFNPDVVLCDCSESNFAGCECTVEGATESCFDGRAELEGVGQCRGGTRTCTGGQWTPCVGQVPPLQEICDNKDNDCDGTTDEDLPLNPCGTCSPDCDAESIGRDGDNGWGLDPETDGLIENDEGGLELPETPQARVTYLWAANSEEGTVSKIDTETGREIGRYVSALRLDNTMPDPLERCPTNSNMPRGNCPSRTAVDLRGDVWVANRAFFAQGSVTKIADNDCVDKNGNGTIETSNDANGNGVIDMNSPQEFFGENDECILFTTKIGGIQSIPRALAIDPFAPVRGVGSVWVGAWNEDRYYQIDAANGTLIRTVDVPHKPYGAVMDRFGTLWSIDLGSSNQNIGPPRGLVSIVSSSNPAQIAGPFAVRSSNRCTGGYGITLDGQDNIWITGFGCEAAYRYTPSTDSWFTVQMPANTGYTRGIAADRNGWVWVGASNQLQSGDAVGHIIRFRGEDGSQIQRFEFTNRGEGTIGVGLDYQERVWGINQVTGNATRLNPDTGSVEHFPVGEGPYTYSDFTGYTLQNFTAPQASFRRVFNGCPERETTIWEKILWEADTPLGTSVEVRIKVVDTLEELAAAPYYGPFADSPANLLDNGVPNGKFAEVEVTLSTDTPGVTPTLWNLELIWTCPPVQ